MSLTNRKSVIGVLRTSVLVAAATVLSTAAVAKVIATDEFEDGTTRPVSIVVLPSHVTLMKQKMIRREDQVEEAGDLEEHLTAAIVQQFREHGYDAKAVTADMIAADPGLQEVYIDASRRFREMLTNLEARLGKSKNVRDRRYNVGDEIKLLAARLGVDAVALGRMQIVVPAAGVRAMNFGMGGEQTMLSVTVADGASADVEAYITLPVLGRGKMFGGHDDIVNNPAEEMGNYAEATLEDIPEADSSLRAETSEEDVLDDLDSLLE